MKREVKNPAERLIVALDFSTPREALTLVDQLSSHVSFFKIGLQLYTIAGPEIVREVTATGAKIFLDLKLHDIPNTVAKAVAAAGDLRVEMLTVHLSGGRKMLEAAVAAAPPELLLLGVTVLTSSDESTLQETGVSDSVAAQTLRLAQLGRTAGVNGLIASPHELRSLRNDLGECVTIITPGVRPAWAAADDQKRFTSPAEAVRNGADYLVIGRPITAHKEPLEATRAIIAELT
ncbi:MAG: orotidine-5'-phosphate decarboxylase [Verrucomicrobiota bacterium]|nr:orotidine-5'-phosphate decarboxylase [Verrucomicrobiota bacterium]